MIGQREKLALNPALLQSKKTNIFPSLSSGERRDRLDVEPVGERAGEVGKLDLGQHILMAQR
jgi:hypothetical protein